MINTAFAVLNLVTGVAGTVCMVLVTIEFVRSFRNERRREEEEHIFWERQIGPE